MRLLENFATEPADTTTNTNNTSASTTNNLSTQQVAKLNSYTHIVNGKMVLEVPNNSGLTTQQAQRVINSICKPIKTALLLRREPVPKHLHQIHYLVLCLLADNIVIIVLMATNTVIVKEDGITLLLSPLFKLHTVYLCMVGRVHQAVAGNKN